MESRGRCARGGLLGRLWEDLVPGVDELRHCRPRGRVSAKHAQDAHPESFCTQAACKWKGPFIVPSVGHTNTTRSGQYPVQ